MNILILESEDYSAAALRTYGLLGRVYLWSLLTPKEKTKLLKLVDILVVRLDHQINKRWLDQMPNLKIIATPTTGLNHIDFESALRQKIKVISLRGQTNFLKNITSTAELTLGLILVLARKIPDAFENVKSGKWDRMSFRGHQLYGKTLGIIGYGRLGKIMARYGKAFGMRIIANDLYIKTKSVKLVGLEELLKTADVVSLHILLDDKNKGFIKTNHLKLMKPTAYFINTARAELLEKGALYQALSNKWIAGAAIDVMWDERSDGGHLKKDPLWSYAKKNNNLIIVPHIGGATFEAMHITEDFIANEVKKCVKSKKLK